MQFSTITYVILYYSDGAILAELYLRTQMKSILTHVKNKLNYERKWL